MMLAFHNIGEKLFMLQLSADLKEAMEEGLWLFCNWSCGDKGVQWILQQIFGDVGKSSYIDPKLDDFMDVYRKEKLIRTLIGGQTRWSSLLIFSGSFDSKVFHMIFGGSRSLDFFL